jgi:probable HAF family extracellular repeat protein
MSKRVPCRCPGHAVTSLTRAVVSGLLVLFLTLALPTGPAEAQLYLLTDLGQTHLYNDRMGINNAGQVVFANGVQGEIDRAYLFDSQGTRELTVPLRMELIPGYYHNFTGDAVPYDINSQGQVVGFKNMDPTGCCPRAILWDSTGVRSLNPLLGDSHSIARAINDMGQIVGYGRFAHNYELGLRAFLFDGTRMLDLGALPPHQNSRAYDINNRGQVIGVSLSKFSQPDDGRAFLYDETGMHDLGTLGGATSVARAINDHGQVVGDSLVTGGWSRQAFLWENGVMKPLAGLTRADGINNRGQIIGQDAHGQVVWHNGVIINIDRHLMPGTDWIVIAVHAINDQGQVVGLAHRRSGGPAHAVLLTPVPAPIARVSSETLSFGDPGLENPSAPLLLTLTNGGDQPLTVSAVSVEGAHGADFRITEDTGEASIPPGASRSFRVVFTTSEVGRREANLVITTNAVGSPHQVSLSGSVTSARVHLSPDSLSFDAQPVGTQSPEQTITVVNSGNAPLTISEMTLDGDHARDFVTAGFSGFALGPGQTGSLRIRFAPTAGGSRQARLALVHDGPGSPHLVALKGTATAPAVGISISGLAAPRSVTFGNQPIAIPGAARSITVTNTGNAPLALQSIAVTGGRVGEFILSGDHRSGLLAPGASRTLSIRFTPQAKGNRSALLTITTNAAGSPHRVTLGGQGVTPVGVAAKRALIPTTADLWIEAIDGTAVRTRQTVVSVGQCVTLGLEAKFPDGAVVGLSADQYTRIWAAPRRGRFQAKSVWCPGPEDVGKTVTLYGRYYSPYTRRPFVASVKVTVR